MGLQSFNISLEWFGKKGMVWEQVEPTISNLCYSRNPPNFIMIHCGGNSIGTSSLRQLQRFMKLTINNIQNALPQTTIIWSQILPRQYYRHMFCRAGYCGPKKVLRYIAISKKVLQYIAIFINLI